MGQFDNVEFRTFDYDGFKDSLFQMAKSVFPNWTDTLESNSGVMMIEWIAFLGANIVYMQNFHARQAFVPTVTEAQSLAWLAKQYAYDIPNNTASVATVRISNANAVPFVFDVIIPEGTQVTTAGNEALVFETTEALIIPQGAVFGDVNVKNQETKIEADIADGNADFKSEMTYGPFIQNSMSVDVDGAIWGKVDNFLDSLNTSEHYRVEVDSDQIATVIFGDGVNGKVPLANSNVTYTYKVGGGSQGNIPPGVIINIDGTFFDVNNNPVDLIVANTTAATGGGDREDIEVTRLRLPASIAAKDVTLNYEDFIANVGSVPGVARVNPKTVNDDPNIPENTVFVFVLPANDDVLSPALEAEIKAVLEDDPTVLTQNVIFVGPSFKNIPIVIEDLIPKPEFDDGTGVYSAATIEIIDNVFDVGDTVTVNGVVFEANVDFVVGADELETAVNLAEVINISVDPLVSDIEAEAVGAIVTLQARTTGPEADAYTLAESDGVTDNMTLSGATFTGGEDSTLQAAVRAAIEKFFGRTNLGEDGNYTVGFAQPVYRNEIIWLIQGVEGIEKFHLVTPAAEVTALQLNEFPTYTLQFTTT